MEGGNPRVEGGSWVLGFWVFGNGKRGKGKERMGVGGVFGDFIFGEKGGVEGLDCGMGEGG